LGASAESGCPRRSKLHVTTMTGPPPRSRFPRACALRSPSRSACGSVTRSARRLCHAAVLLATLGGAAVAQPDDVASLPLDVAALDQGELHAPLPGVPFPGPPGPAGEPVGDVTDEEIETF